MTMPLIQLIRPIRQVRALIVVLTLVGGGVGEVGMVRAEDIKPPITPASATTTTDPITVDVIPFAQISYSNQAEPSNSRIIGGRISLTGPLSGPESTKPFDGFLSLDLHATPGTTTFDVTQPDQFGKSIVLEAGASWRFSEVKFGDHDSLRKAVYCEFAVSSVVQDAPDGAILDRFPRRYDCGIRLTHDIGGNSESELKIGWGRNQMNGPFHFGQWWIEGHIHLAGTSGRVVLGGAFGLNAGPAPTLPLEKARDYGMLWVGINIPSFFGSGSGGSGGQK